MRKTLLSTTTALALLVALPALAATDSTSPTIGQSLDKGVAATQEAVSDAVDKVRDMTTDNGTVDINPKASAAGIIGQKVYNVRKEEVGKVEDVLIDQNGNASQIILTNGGFLGIGAKLVAVDFSLVYTRTDNNDVIVPITDETVKRMVPFSYDVSDATAGLHTIPAGNLSAKAILDGHLLNAQNVQIGAIDNLTIGGNYSGRVLASYNTTMGMGGGVVAMPYDQLQKINHGTTVDFKLTDVQSAKFENYLKAVN